MNFKHKNLSKTLVCALMPMLVACGGGKSRNADEDREMQALDSAYNAAVVAEHTYLNAMNMIMEDYKGSNQRTGYKNEVLSEYQIKKLFQMSDSLAYYRGERKRLFGKMVELQTTK
ncbi:hypothetical protein HDR61_03475 [bacterium]|nr:hypothetical protein [bacterium]